MKRLNIIIIGIVLMLGATSCGSNRTYQEKVSAMISKIKSPFLITSLKPQNLIDKSGVNEDGVLPYTYQTLTSFFLQEEGTGVDYDERLQIVLAKGPMIPNMYGFFRIQDQALFKEMVKSELNAKIKDKDGTNYFIKEKDGYVLAWQDGIGIVANIPFDIKAMFSGGGDDGHKTLNRMIGLFEASGEAEINKDYQTFLTKSDDINVYLMPDSLMDYVNELNPLGKKKNKTNSFEELNDSKIELALNFEKGKAILKSDMKFSDEFLAKINFIENKGVESTYLSFGKSPNPLTVYSLNVDLEKYLTFIDDFSKGQMSNDINESLSKFGLTTQDVVKAFKGEILVMFDGINIQTKTVDYGYGEPFEEQNIEPLLGVVVGIKDQSFLNQLFENAEVVSEQMIKMEDLFVVLKDDKMFMSNDSLWADMVMKGQGVSIKTDKVINNQPIASYTNFENEKIAEYFKKEGYDPTAILESAVMFTNVTNGEIVLNLKNKNDNSLKVLVKFYSDLMADYEAKQNEEMQQILDQEILDNLNESMEQLDSVVDVAGQALDEALENVDVDEVLDDATKEMNKLLKGLKH